jgi:hypothetical protein
MAESAYIPEASLSALKRLRQTRQAGERCELCALPLETRHAHLLDPKERRILCSCDACALLFQNEDASGRYRRIPRDAFHLADFRLDDLQWEALSIPINLAFFFFSTVANRTLAFYPSPAGATESLLDFAAWNEVAAGHPRIQQLQPDVEALLVNRLANPPEYYIAPIDRCYELAGIVRKQWQGFTGGSEVWEAIAGFFTSLRNEAVKVERQHA